MIDFLFRTFQITATRHQLSSAIGNLKGAECLDAQHACACMHTSPLSSELYLYGTQTTRAQRAARTPDALLSSCSMRSHSGILRAKKGVELSSSIQKTIINHLNWTEIRAAYLVGELQTLSRAAKHLGVHRSTLMRQITTLEEQVGRKIFIRRRDGYLPTEFGRELIAVARHVDKDIQAFFERRSSDDHSPRSVITIAAPSSLSCLMMAALPPLRRLHPDLWCSFLDLDSPNDTATENADIAFSLHNVATPEYPAQIFTTLEMNLYASSDYVRDHGKLKTLTDLADHAFVCSYPNFGTDDTDAWLRIHVPARNIVFRSTSKCALNSAIERGLGIGFMPTLIAEGNENLVP
ncbi:MAG: LysR family transcriptional regulator, partial [Planctomycetota bacterium]